MIFIIIVVCLRQPSTPIHVSNKQWLSLFTCDVSRLGDPRIAPRALWSSAKKIKLLWLLLVCGLDIIDAYSAGLDVFMISVNIKCGTLSVRDVGRAE